MAKQRQRSKTSRVPDSLYGEGWRQGSVFHAELPLDTVVMQGEAIGRETTGPHGVWVVAEQDCNLAGTDADETGARIEVRPVYMRDPPTDWGIRSRRFRLDDAGRYLQDQTPRVLVSPAVLTSAAATREPPLPSARALAFKTWLGLRYDRPAVPDRLIPLAKSIAEMLRRPGGRLVAARVRDVLMQFDESQSPPQFALFAVLDDGADAAEVRAWLATAALAVSHELGVGVSFEVGTSAETSLYLLETSYAADASQLTWSGREPQGAT